MRIQKLEFTNINSYYGSTCIDFTDDFFRKAGYQFVIEGETGAGKTTILDAISLALYGQTARMESVKLSEDRYSEVMNKKSGYMSASVTYTCTEGTFVSTFYVNRAYKKPDGAMQDPSCTVKNVETGEERIKNDSRTNLEKETQKLTGLDYNQFIKCVLIPQGEFDRFLSSKEEEKADILAKIGNTEIYKKVGKKLGEQAKQIRDDLKKEEVKLNAIIVMNDEERAEKENEKVALAAEAEKTVSEIGILTEKINLKSQYVEAAGKLKKAEEEKGRIDGRKDEIDQIKLESDIAQKAGSCESSYVTLKNKHNDLQAENSKLKKIEEGLPGIIQSLKQAEKDLEAVQNGLKDKKSEYEEKKNIWKKVRDIDSRLKEKKESLSDKKKIYNKAEKSLKENREKVEAAQKDIVTLEAEQKTLKEYLEKNEKDADLKSKLATLKEKRISLKEALKNRSGHESEIKDKTEELTKCRNRKTSLEDEKTNIEGKLFEVVKGEHILISDMLRQNLKEGDHCPVCGAVYHPDSSENPELDTHEGTAESLNTGDELSGKRSKLAFDVTKLSKDLKKAEEDLNKLNTEIETRETSVRSLTELINRENERINDFFSDINGLLNPWDKKLSKSLDTAEEELIKIENELSASEQCYQEKEKKKTENESVLKGKRAVVESIDLKQLEKDKDNADSEMNAVKAECDKFDTERKELFGDKDVDAEEENFEKELRALENQKDTVKKAEETKKQEKESEEAKKKLSIENIEKLEKDIMTAEKDFLQKVKDNDLEAENLEQAEKAYLKAKRSLEEVKSMNEKIQAYESEKAEAAGAYKKATEDMDKLSGLEIPEEALEDLKKSKAEKEIRRDQINTSIGELNNKLKTDEANKEKKNKQRQIYQEKSEEDKIFKDIMKMVGNQDGSDLNIFVQSIAMRSLLDKANDYLEGILPKYTLIPGDKELEIFINEMNGEGALLERKSSNLSGGERFVVSLSLALAIAEMVGQNGSVDNIFLDEGFGTLSGQPLSDAIVALKKLAGTGKMLGIITHVEAVINEFEQLHARFENGKSILSGSGVLYSGVVEKQTKKKG